MKFGNKPPVVEIKKKPKKRKTRNIDNVRFKSFKQRQDEDFDDDFNQMAGITRHSLYKDSNGKVIFGYQN